MSDIPGELITFKSESQNETPTWTLSIPITVDNNAYLKKVQKAEDMAFFISDLKTMLKSLYKNGLYILDLEEEKGNVDTDSVIAAIREWIYNEIVERGINFDD